MQYGKRCTIHLLFFKTSTLFATRNIFVFLNFAIELSTPRVPSDEPKVDSFENCASEIFYWLPLNFLWVPRFDEPKGPTVKFYCTVLPQEQVLVVP